MREDLRELLETAEEDLKAAKENFKLNFFRISAFLSQQAVEKFLKAYLLYMRGKYPFTHSISELLKLCVKESEDFRYLIEIRANILEDYYTGVRYPPLIRVSREDAREAIEIADKVREFILKRLPL